jgi:ML domain
MFLKSAFLVLLGFMSSVSASVSDCSNGDALFTLDSMSFSPDPPVLGENSTLLLSMAVPEEINNGTARYSVKYNFLPLAPTVDDLCGVTVACPIAVGTLDTRSSYPFDEGLSGSIVMKVEWFDLTGRRLLCVSMSFLVKGASKQLVDRKYYRNHLYSRYHRHHSNYSNLTAAASS